MSLHKVRFTPAKGFQAVYKGNKAPTKGIMVRLPPADFALLRRRAVARGTPLASIIRDAVAFYLRATNGRK